MLLVGANSQVGARLARAQQNETGFPVLGKISIGIRLVHLAPPFQAPGAGQAAPLVAKRGQGYAGSQRRVPDVLLAADNYGVLALRRQQCDAEDFAAGL